MKENKRIAIIAGAGPAGLTAAYELLTRTNVVPIILELDHTVGGISRTVYYKGNRMDIGGHRFFSKSERVMNWWFDKIPLQKLSGDNHLLTLKYQNRIQELQPQSDGPDPASADTVMLVRSRLSRIFYRRKFYDYPVRLNLNTIRNLGMIQMVRIGISYVKSRLFPIKNEKSLEDFFINRFGKELYITFFRDYTEKVWGVPCNAIKPEWGAQRIKGLSVSKALWHALRSIFPRETGVRQKEVETSLIDRFLYPKYGPGQLWQVVAGKILEMGGTIHFGEQVQQVICKDNRVRQIISMNRESGVEKIHDADFFFSTMPVRELISGMQPQVNDRLKELSEGLIYRDFITVGLLFRRMITPSDTQLSGSPVVPDNWIYIQESDVKVGRIQVFNNWSPWMVGDPEKAWLGLEYFCQENDSLWSMSDADLIRLAVDELAIIGLCHPEDHLDGVVVRMPKTYPAYFGTYEHFDEIRRFTDLIPNLFLIGRNGMHRYNNQDHSMLTAMIAVDNILHEIDSKENIWMVNTEEEYHETPNS